MFHGAPMFNANIAWNVASCANMGVMMMNCSHAQSLWIMDHESCHQVRMHVPLDEHLKHSYPEVPPSTYGPKYRCAIQVCTVASSFLVPLHPTCVTKMESRIARQLSTS